MHARVTTVKVGPGEPDSTAEIFEQIVPMMRELDGYRGIVVLHDLAEPQFLVLSLWETAEAMEASDATASRITAAETAERDYEVEGPARYRVDAFDVPR
jgi:heme-degrading monooxygenase HmoA